MARNITNGRSFDIIARVAIPSCLLHTSSQCSKMHVFIVVFSSWTFIIIIYFCLCSQTLSLRRTNKHLSTSTNVNSNNYIDIIIATQRQDSWLSFKTQPHGPGGGYDDDDDAVPNPNHPSSQPTFAWASIKIERGLNSRLNFSVADITIRIVSSWMFVNF